MLGSKSHKQLLIAGVLLGMCVLLYYYAFGELKPEANLKQNYLVKQSRHPIFFLDFQFDGHKQGDKVFSIKAAKLSVEKKKLGLFRSGAIRTAVFKSAEIDIYAQPVELDNNVEDDRQQSNYSLNGVFTEDTMPAHLFKNVVSLIFEPVKINFHTGKTLTTQIMANKATVNPKARKIIFQGEVLATSEYRSLAADELTLFPANMLFKSDQRFVLQSPEKQIVGNNLTADLSLNLISKQGFSK